MKASTSTLSCCGPVFSLPPRSD